MPRLLMLSYPFLPSVTAGAIRTERFARHLRPHGWDSHIVTIAPRRDLFHDAQRMESLGPGIAVHRTRNRDPWLRLKAWEPRWPIARAPRSLGMKIFSFPDHMLWWAPAAVRLGLALARSGEVDAVYTTSPPHSTHLAGLWLTQATGLPWVADFRDPWTQNRHEELYQSGAWPTRFLMALEASMERRVLRRASAILANTPSNRRHLLARYPWLPPAKVVHLPNGWEAFPPDDAPPLPGNRPLTIVHAGTFYPGFKPYGLLQALASWRDGGQNGQGAFPAHRLQVVLLGASDAATRQVVADLHLEDVVSLHPWVAVGEARRIMATADILWASLGTGPASRTFVPSKLFDYIAAGRPILGFFPEGDAAELIRSTGTGIVFTSDQPGPVIQLLARTLTGQPQAFDWFAPRPDVLARYRIESLAEHLARLLHRLKAAAAPADNHPAPCAR